MKTFKRLVLITLAAMLLFCTPAMAKIKSYKAKKVTATQIIKQVKKKMPITNIVPVSRKSRPDLAPMFDHPNMYKTKINFNDRSYPSIYCSVEVFRSNHDAATRLAELNVTATFYDILGITIDFPSTNYRYKNTIIRLNDAMPTAYALKYYKLLKKIIK